MREIVLLRRLSTPSDRPRASTTDQFPARSHMGNLPALPIRAASRHAGMWPIWIRAGSWPGKNKGKTRTVVKTLTKYVTEDFGWKDPKAAQKAGMSLKDYVIGGMDRDFRGKLYNALRAIEDAGLSPGITSGFRDDYRQELANGNKAAPDSSYHGGSRRGGYGHGLAADLVSVKGETRAERCTWSEILWKWIDANEKELGIGRPYLDKDPPHVAPIDGKEYADKRSAANARLAGLKKPSPSSNPK